MKKPKKENKCSKKLKKMLIINNKKQNKDYKNSSVNKKVKKNAFDYFLYQNNKI